MSGDPGETRAADLRIVAGRPDAVEAAAVLAVLTQMLQESAAPGARVVPTAASRWERSARGLRGTVAPGPGVWAASRPFRY